jgi:hypothetical protein
VSTPHRLGLLAVAALLAGSGCSSSPTVVSPPTPLSTNTRTTSLERALLAKKGAPRPTTATCTTPGSRPAKSPFGTDRQPLYICQLTVSGATASYFVEVQANGCYVAERARKGQALYGCGAKPAAGNA